MCDLGLTIEGSKLVASIAQLHAELENRKLAFEPHYWLSDEWFTPDGVGGIAIPFYLAHPRLEQLEERQMLEVEGGTHDWCVKILRHEAGHAIDNAYQLQRRRKRLKLFGPSSAEYPEYYTPKPYTKSFVLHLDSWYAQSHPDEDFAETFAVWLNPHSQWRERYADWPALKKLEYMDELMQELAGHPPRRVSRRKLAPLPSLKKTLRQHYDRKRAALRLRVPELLRPRSAPAVHRGGRGAQGQPAGHAFPRPHPQGRLPPRLALDRRVPLHHRPRLRGRDHPLPRAEPAAGQASGGGDAGVHDSADRPDHELPAQRPAPGGAMRKLRVLALMHDYLVPPKDVTGIDLSTAKWKMEYDVTHTLEVMGHDVRALGLGGDLGVITEAVKSWDPHIVFNLMENFEGIAMFDQNVVSHLELLRVPYTGCNPRGLMLARDKALSKTLLAYHRLPVPEFTVFRVGRAVQRPKRLQFPVIVKSLTQESSIGISQASVVEDEAKLLERVRFIHRKVGTDAIAERYVEGRELYVGVIGNLKLQVFPVWEMKFDKMPEHSYRIATERVKWNDAYQKKHGITTVAAGDLPEELAGRVGQICRRVYRTLDLSGYARIDLRLDAEGRVYVLEANPNPQLAYGEDFAESAHHAGVSYETLLQKILTTGLSWRPERQNFA